MSRCDCSHADCAMSISFLRSDVKMLSQRMDKMQALILRLLEETP